MWSIKGFSQQSTLPGWSLTSSLLELATQDKPNYRCERSHFGEKMTSVWVRVAGSHNQQLKQQCTETTNTTKQHNITVLWFKTFKKETQTGRWKLWWILAVTGSTEAKKGNYTPSCKNDLRVNITEFITLQYFTVKNIWIDVFWIFNFWDSKNKFRLHKAWEKM